MKFFQNKKKKEINKLADKIIRQAKKEESSRKAEKNRPSTISIKLVSRCCGARVEYSEFYIFAALMGEEHFRCTKCGKDPCWVEEKREKTGECMSEKIRNHENLEGGMNMAKDERKINAKEMQEDDPCVCCGKPSGEKRGTPIGQRLYYVEGAGQLCKKCYSSVYN